MSDQIFLIINIAIISVFQFFVMVSYLHKKNKGKFFSNLIGYLIITLLILYEYFSNLNIPNFIITCSLITIIGHSFIGTLLDIYHSSKFYDRYLHLFGCFSFSLLIYSVLNEVITQAIESKIYVFLFIMTLGITIGAFFEIAEFIHDNLSKQEKYQHGLIDTNFDIIFNIVGSFLAAIVSIRIF